MLTDPREIEIISRARQKNVRLPTRSRQHFVNIFDDFFDQISFDEGPIIDLGPGHYDFGVIATERGATDVLGFDNDEAVLELGRHKGFRTVSGKIQEVSSSTLNETFSGVFNKFALNSFWFFDNQSAQIEFVDRIAGLIKPNGWGWIAPWNGIPKKAELNDDEISDILQTQARRFEHHGFEAFDLTAELSARYGVTGSVANNAIFTKGLNTDCLRYCKKL